MVDPPGAALSAAAWPDNSVIPGRCEASNPESRDSGSGANAPSRNDSASQESSTGARSDLLLLAGEFFRRDGPFVTLPRLQTLPIGGDVGPEILCQPDVIGQP